MHIVDLSEVKLYWHGSVVTTELVLYREAYFVPNSEGSLREA